MENILITVKRLKKSVLSSGKSMSRNPSLAWSALLMFFAVGAIGAGAAGYLIFLDASSGKEEEVVTSIGTRNILRPGDIASVLKVYQEKKEHLNAIIAEQPSFLPPGRTSSDIPSVEIPESPTTEFVP